MTKPAAWPPKKANTMNNLVRYVILLLIAPVSFTHAGGLAINSLHGAQGDTVTFAISVDDAPNAVKALIMDIKYNPDSMTFLKYQRGALGASGYPMMIVNEYKPGMVRVGAADPLEQGIIQGDSGDFLYLTFKVSGDTESALSFSTLKDDLEQWNTSPGYLIRDDLEEEPESEEDRPTKSESKSGEEPLPAEEDQESGTTEELAETSRNAGAIEGVSFLNEEANERTDSLSDTKTALPGQPLIKRAGMGRGEMTSGRSVDGDFLGSGIKSPAKQLTQAEKIAEINRYVNGNPVIEQTQNQQIGKGYSTPVGGKSNRPIQPGTMASFLPDNPAPSAISGSLEWLSSLMAVLLLVVLVLVAVLMMILAAILGMLILIYLKLRSLEKSGQISIHGPFFSVTHSGQESVFGTQEQYVS